MFRPTLLVVLLSVGLTLAISMDRMLTSSIDKCIGGSSSAMKTTTEDCFRNQIIEYLSPSSHKDINGTPRTINNNNIDDKGEFILNSLTEIAKNNIFRLELPEVFQRATLVFRPNRGLDFSVEFPNDEENDVTPRQARDMMKQKMLFPLLMLIKLKLKALTPILLAIVGLKATKALFLSKIAILLVIGFLVVQLCQKLGMAKMNMQPAGAMPPPMEPSVTPPVPMYGPPTTLSSYDPSGWEPAPGPPGPYSRVYETNPSTTSHHMAYSAYSTQAAKYRR